MTLLELIEEDIIEHKKSLEIYRKAAHGETFEIARLEVKIDTLQSVLDRGKELRIRGRKYKTLNDKM